MPLTLDRKPEPYGARLQAALPTHAAGRWCHLRVTLTASSTCWAKLELTDEARGQIVREQFLRHSPAQGAHWKAETFVHIPQGAQALTILLFGTAPGEASASLRILSRRQAALRLALQGWRLLPSALRGSPLGAAGRVRAVLGQAPARAASTPPYAAWIALCEPAACAAPPTNPAEAARAWPGQIVIVAGAPAATAASLAAAAAQLQDRSAMLVVPGQAESTRAADPSDATGVPVAAADEVRMPGEAEAVRMPAAAGWAAVTGPWVLLLQAGEILRHGALAAFSEAIEAAPDATLITADCDRLAPDCTRHDPLFKPGPDPLLLPSGLPVQGACALRWRNVPANLPRHAHAVRLHMASRAGAAIVHVPGILSHIRPDCEPPPAGPPTIGHAKPPRTESSASPPVTILIPTQARSPHVARCIGAVADGTAYANFAITLLLSAPDRADPAILVRLCQPSPNQAGKPHHPVTIVNVPAGAFNYAAVNNAGAAATQENAAPATTHESLLLLMNDDVAPIEPGWLDAMVAHMRDPTVGIVGARLLYGNGMVQHEGVIMGLANLCEHAGRLRPGHSAGPHGLALLDRHVSAVTGACLLIRASLYHQLGGMDEAYAVALNDVDLCLRAREAGWGVVYCAQATLHHFESLSLGRHYAGARAGLEAVEVRRLRARFAAVIAADPCYNPLASLQPGQEWQPAFPPRPMPPTPRHAGHPPKPAAIA